MCEDLTLLYLEIPKYAKNRDPRSRLEYWLLYLAGMEAKKMPEAMVKDPMIGQALDLEKLFLQNQMERYNYLLSYKAMWDAETNDEAIRRAALAKGEAKGRAEGRAEAARNLLRMGLELSQISEATGLSPEEIEALRGASTPAP